MVLSFPAAELIGNFVACILYGVYLVTSGFAGRALLTTERGRIRRRSEIKWVNLVVAVVFLLNGTFDLILSLSLTFRAFVLYTGPGGAEHVFLDAANWQNLAKSSSITVQTLIGDAILIYRCWFLYYRSWHVVALPALIWLANVACAIGILVNQSTVGRGLVNSGMGLDWGLGFWILTISNNVTSTTLIVVRIWRVENLNKKYRSHEEFQIVEDDDGPCMLTKVIRNIVESGMIYTISSLVELSMYATGGTPNYLASGQIHIVGIAFNLLVIRRANLRAEDPVVVASTIRFNELATARVSTVPSIDDDDRIHLSRREQSSNFDRTNPAGSMHVAVRTE